MGARRRATPPANSSGSPLVVHQEPHQGAPPRAGRQPRPEGQTQLARAVGRRGGGGRPAQGHRGGQRRRRREEGGHDAAQPGHDAGARGKGQVVRAEELAHAAQLGGAAGAIHDVLRHGGAILGRHQVDGVLPQDLAGRTVEAEEGDPQLLLQPVEGRRLGGAGGARVDVLRDLRRGLAVEVHQQRIRRDRLGVDAACCGHARSSCGCGFYRCRFYEYGSECGLAGDVIRVNGAVRSFRAPLPRTAGCSDCAGSAPGRCA